jgi:hypothetical protein
MGPRRNVRGGASGKTAMGLAAASVVAATAAGGVLWYQKNNKKNYIIDMFIEACNNFDDNTSSGTIGIQTFYNLGKFDTTFGDFLQKTTLIKKQRVKEIYDNADRMVKNEFNVKSNQSLNEYHDDGVDSVLHKLKETNIDPKIYLTRLFAYFRLTCYFVSFDCFANNEWGREKYNGYNNMMLFPRFLERFLSLCFQFDDKFNFEFYRQIAAVELQKNNESNEIFRLFDGIVLEESTFIGLLSSIRNYTKNVNKKKFEMQKECLKQKYETLNTDLHRRMDTEKSGAGEGAGLGAGLGALRSPTTSQTHGGIATSGQQQTGAATANIFQVDDVWTTAGEATKFQVNQDVWFKPRWIEKDYPATILKVPRWADENYEIQYTDDSCYNESKNKHESQIKKRSDVEEYRLRPRFVGQQPRQF